MTFTGWRSAPASWINAGELGSGTALTTSTLYRVVFAEALPESSTTFLRNETRSSS